MAAKWESFCSSVDLSRHVFVTQPVDANQTSFYGNRKGSDVYDDKLLLNSRRTLQSTLLLRKQNQLASVSEDFDLGRAAFSRQITGLQGKRLELIHKQSELKEKTAKFGHLLRDTEMKRQRALKTYQKERKQCFEKDQELEKMRAEVVALKEERDHLVSLVEKYGMYEQFLARSVERMPDVCVEGAVEASIQLLIARYKAMRATNAEARQRSGDLGKEYKAMQKRLSTRDSVQTETIMNCSRRLSEAQEKLGALMRKNHEQQETITERETACRENRQLFSKIVLAIENIREQCVYPGERLGKCESSTVNQLQKIEEFILDRTAILELAHKQSDADAGADQQPIAIRQVSQQNINYRKDQRYQRSKSAPLY